MDKGCTTQPKEFLVIFSPQYEIVPELLHDTPTSNNSKHTAKPPPDVITNQFYFMFLKFMICFFI
jgi:hypothetical protein